MWQWNCVELALLSKIPSIRSVVVALEIIRAWCGTYHVQTIPRCVAGDDIDFLIGVEPDHILEFESA